MGIVKHNLPTNLNTHIPSLNDLYLRVVIKYSEVGLYREISVR